MKINKTVLDYFEGLPPAQIRIMRERTLQALELIRADIDRERAAKNSKSPEKKAGAAND